jgi:hypothetical protein
MNGVKPPRSESALAGAADTAINHRQGNDMELNNARVPLTGATDELGWALAAQGADLLRAGCDEARLENCVSGIGGTGRVALSLRAALQGGRGESHFGFPERRFAWLNACAPALIELALKARLAIVERHPAHA